MHLHTGDVVVGEVLTRRSGVLERLLHRLDLRLGQPGRLQGGAHRRSQLPVERTAGGGCGPLQLQGGLKQGYGRVGGFAAGLAVFFNALSYLDWACSTWRSARCRANTGSAWARISSCCSFMAAVAFSTAVVTRSCAPACSVEASACR